MPGVGPRLDGDTLSPLTDSSVVPGGVEVVVVPPREVDVVTLDEADTVVLVAGAGVVGVGTSLGSSPQPATTMAMAMTGGTRRRITPQRVPRRPEQQPGDHVVADRHGARQVAFRARSRRCASVATRSPSN